jgi:hypothetical protein
MTANDPIPRYLQFETAYWALYNAALADLNKPDLTARIAAGGPDVETFLADRKAALKGLTVDDWHEYGRDWRERLADLIERIETCGCRKYPRLPRTKGIIEDRIVQKALILWRADAGHRVANNVRQTFGIHRTGPASTPDLGSSNIPTIPPAPSPNAEPLTRKPLDQAIAACLQEGLIPGQNCPWEKFCIKVRAKGSVDENPNRRPRGWGNENIEKRTRAIVKEQNA